MSLKNLRDELSDDVSSILDSSFTIDITTTSTVPGPDDAAITFPNLDNSTQGAKLIETCVLYIDMRRSTVLSFSHRPQTVAKLYSAFVRAMTRTALYYGGHVRGIVGDRVMVLFDTADCFKNSVNCAVAMHTISEYIINHHFKANEVKFGIGIDYGRMLATKMGIRRHGREQGNYRNLAWLGRPANVASKLTDAANKPAEYVTVPNVSVAYETSSPSPAPSGLAGLLFDPLPSNPFGLAGAVNPNPFGSALAAAFGGTAGGAWKWTTESMEEFLKQLEVRYVPPHIVHKRSDFVSFFVSSGSTQTRQATPPILMTAEVWAGFRKAAPETTIVKQPLFAKVPLSVPGYGGQVFGGNVVFPALK